MKACALNLRVHILNRLKNGEFYSVPPVVIKQDNESSTPPQLPFFTNQGPRKHVTAIVKKLLISVLLHDQCHYIIVMHYA